jgi:hypothetical protein
MIIYILLLLFIGSNTIEINRCCNCKYYIPNTFKGEYMIGYYYGKCSKYLLQNMITGELEYLSTNEARNKKELCGLTGKYYVPSNMTTANYPLFNDN